MVQAVKGQEGAGCRTHSLICPHLPDELRGDCAQKCLGGKVLSYKDFRLRNFGASHSGRGCLEGAANRHRDREEDKQITEHLLPEDSRNHHTADNVAYPDSLRQDKYQIRRVSA